MGARTKTDGPHPVDVHVGTRIHVRRVLTGMTQEKLADLLGLTFQQVQKYERGSNRVSASRLYQIAGHLKVPVGYFFEGYDVQADLAAPAVDSTEPLDKRETLELVRAYYRAPDRARKLVYDLVKSLAQLDEAEAGS